MENKCIVARMVAYQLTFVEVFVIVTVLKVII